MQPSLDDNVEPDHSHKTPSTDQPHGGLTSVDAPGTLTEKDDGIDDEDDDDEDVDDDPDVLEPIPEAEAG
jgi:hypothetical protein